MFNVLLFPNCEVVILGDFKNIWLKYSTHTDHANQLIELLTRIPDKVIITELFLNAFELAIIVPLEKPDPNLFTGQCLIQTIQINNANLRLVVLYRCQFS